MKKIVFALVVLMFAAPAWAVVYITAEVGECEANTVVTVSFDASDEDPSLVRAFGLNIQCDNDANIFEVTAAFVGVCTYLEQGYGIFPGTIIIDALGEVTDDGSPAAEYDDLPSDTLPGPPDGNGVTIELASLYSPVGPGSVNAPPDNGPLLTFKVDKTCNITISANVSRAGPTGVVMENPDEVVTVNYPAPFFVEVCAEEPDCYDGMVDFDEYDAVGRPPCWCGSFRQCRGDADGLKQGSALAGYMYVGTNDLNVLIDAWKILEPPKGPGLSGNQICADFDHAKQGSALAGYMRVGTNDLTILIAHWKVLEPPKGLGVSSDCLDLP